jgi:hypothetical protein
MGKKGLMLSRSAYFLHILPLGPMDWWQVSIRAFKILYVSAVAGFHAVLMVAGFTTFAGVRDVTCGLDDLGIPYTYLRRCFCCSCFTSLPMSLLMLVSLLLLVSLLFQTSMLLNASLLMLFCITVFGVSRVSRIIDKNVTGSLTRDFLFQVFFNKSITP